ncbi:hypothetical protein DQ237_07925 [Blastococcus sp. TF02-8]|uniref:hypothetical protein n=1 Tax=Blastococcus sp. TF02-8 TaxID=2250574 RepID=UPI000DE81278|nr:hypothetical protein [Blastococcus sp. TF02-8]RBY96552.1 hypothetical protein DQ237_07925 [Blastococcus sp. TF02-8]
MSQPPRWRQAYDAVDRAVTPHAEGLVRTPGFALGVALLRKATTIARSSAQDLTARAWHLVNLPAGSDVHRLRAQVGALDREVRRLTVALEAERRRTQPPRTTPSRLPEDSHADRAQPADDPRPRPARRGAQRPAGT